LAAFVFDRRFVTPLRFDQSARPDLGRLASAGPSGARRSCPRFVLQYNAASHIEIRMRSRSIAAAQATASRARLTRRRVQLGATALLGLLGAATFTAYRRDLSVARSAALDGSAMLQTACGDIEYATRGSGPPVLSIHGTGGGWDQGLFIARGLPERGFQVIAPSRYGYLRTPMPGHPTPQAEADMFACLLDAMQIERVAVIAASAGATPALQFALRHPERMSSLVLLVPAIGGISTPDTVALVSPFILNVVLGSDFPYWAAMKAWPRASLTVVAVPQSLVPTLSAAGRRTLDDAVRMIMPVTLRREGILYDAGNQTNEQPYPLERIRAPTLLVSAEDDLYKTLPNARAAAAKIPGARVMAFRSGGHLMLDRDLELWPAVAAFLSR
jgi:2-hydroxy-6-oxonona-2,4-dienedioate hydrolase